MTPLTQKEDTSYSYILFKKTSPRNSPTLRTITLSKQSYTQEGKAHTSFQTASSHPNNRYVLYDYTTTKCQLNRGTTIAVGKAVGISTDYFKSINIDYQPTWIHYMYVFQKLLKEREECVECLRSLLRTWCLFSISHLLSTFNAQTLPELFNLAT